MWQLIAGLLSANSQEQDARRAATPNYQDIAKSNIAARQAAQQQVGQQGSARRQQAQQGTGTGIDVISLVNGVFKKTRNASDFDWGNSYGE